MQYISPCIVFRAAEAYLNYMEADYVKNGSLDGKSKSYWRALRNRAGVDIDFETTIASNRLLIRNSIGKDVF